MSQTKNMKEKPSLQDSHPELAIEADGWDPADFTFGSDKSMPWKCIIGHQWTARISDRAGGKGRCPMDHAVDMNLVNRNPIQSGSRSGKNLLPRIEVQKPQRALEKDELLALANNAGDYRLLILVAGLLGIRWAELVAITPEDFDFKKKTITVSKSLSEISGRFELVTPKSGKVRVLPLLSVLEKDLKARCLATPEGEPIFKSQKGGYLLHGNFMKRVFAPALAKAEVRQLLWFSDFDLCNRIKIEIPSSQPNWPKSRLDCIQLKNFLNN